MTTLELLRNIDRTLEEVRLDGEPIRRTPCRIKQYRQEEANAAEASINALSAKLNEEEGF